MVRSMYSGVTGMKAHQTKMDVIGNNISNVNTYGFKSSRATFRDVYYQNIRNAAAPTGTAGGTNPSAVGYGAVISSVDLMMTPSTVTNTGNSMDLAINGDGFFQVQDADGNTFYTRAGMMDIDSQGNLVDMNGYFVLGVSGSPIGQKPSSNKINVLDAMGSVPATKAAKTEEINGVSYTITASKNTAEGNVSFQFIPADDLPIGQKAEAIVGTSAITIRLNENEYFTDLADLQMQVNTAITTALKGKEHPAGQFTLTMDPLTGKWPAIGALAPGRPAGLTGAEVCGTNFGYVKGELKTPTLTPATPPATGMVNYQLFGGFTVKEVGNLFSGDGNPTYSLTHHPAAAGAAEYFTIQVAIAGGNTYTADITKEQMNSAGEVKLFRAGATAADKTKEEYNQNTITMTFPKFDSVKQTALLNGAAAYDAAIAAGTAVPTLTFAIPAGTTYADGVALDAYTASPSYSAPDLGLGSRSIKLVNGTEGGALEVKDLTGIAIGADGVIVASHSILGQKEVGRIDLANFNNAAALQQTGNSYYSVSQNSGTPGLSIPGSSGAGTLKASSLELSNVDLSQEFADLITTQRGFQANSRLITVSDTMLEELVNLKR